MLHAVYGAWVQSLWAQLWSKFIGCHQKRQHRRAESGQVWCQAKLSRHNMTTWDPKIWDENSFGKCVYWYEDIEALVSQYNAGSSYRFINFLTGHQTNSCSTSECMLGLSEASALWQKMWQNIKVTERHGRFVWILPGKPSSAACRGGDVCRKHPDKLCENWVSCKKFQTLCKGIPFLSSSHLRIAFNNDYFLPPVPTCLKFPPFCGISTWQLQDS